MSALSASVHSGAARIDLGLPVSFSKEADSQIQNLQRTRTVYVNMSACMWFSCVTFEP